MIIRRGNNASDTHTAKIKLRVDVIDLGGCNLPASRSQEPELLFDGGTNASDTIRNCVSCVEKRLIWAVE